MQKLKSLQIFKAKWKILIMQIFNRFSPFYFTAVFALIGVVTFSVATHMDYGLYFPESLPPTWGNSWAQVNKPLY